MIVLLFKKQVDILRSMVGYTSTITGSVTDFMIGSGVRTMYDAFSIELEEMYLLTQSNIKEGIESGLMSSFDFVPKPANKAYGIFKIVFTEPLTQQVAISRGTSIVSSRQSIDVTYETLIDYVVPEGATDALITAYCTELGTKGNVEKGVMDVFPYSIYKVESVSNIEDILTGADEATYASTKKLFKLFIESRGRATKKSLEYGTLQVQEITGAYVNETVGVAYVYCHDNNGNLSIELRDKVVTQLQEYRPAGIELKVLPIAKYSVDIQLTIVATDLTAITVTFQDTIEKFIKQYLNSFTAGKDLVLADFIQTVMNFDDALLYDCYFDDFDSNVIIDPSEIIRAGEINITFI